MSYTFNDFVTECSIFEYSKGYLNLMKEAAELDLMAANINSIEFRDTFAPMLESSDFYYDAYSYFSEAADTSYDVEYMTAMYEKKTENFFVKIWNGLKWVVRKIIEFFKRIFGVFHKKDAVRRNLLDQLNNFEWTESRITNFFKRVGKTSIVDTSDASTVKEAILSIIPGQPFESEVRLNVSRLKKGRINDIKALKRIIAFVLSDTDVVLTTKALNTKTGKMRVSPDAINIGTLDKIISERNDENAVDIANSLSKVLKANKGTIIISTSDNTISELIKKLEEANKKLTNDIANAQAGNSLDDKQVQSNNQKKVKALESIQKSVAITIGIYNTYLSSREDGMKAFDKFLKDPDDEKMGTSDVINKQLDSGDFSEDPNLAYAQRNRDNTEDMEIGPSQGTKKTKAASGDKGQKAQ